MEKQVYKFTNEITEIKIGVLAAKLAVTAHDEDFIYAEYDNPSDTPKFSATLQDKKLIFKESMLFSLFRNPLEEYTLNVFLPKKLFRSVEISTASGGAAVSDVQAEFFTLNTASGDVNAQGSFENIAIKTASGNVTFVNNAESPAKKLKISSASGNVDVTAPAENYTISGVSGKTVYNGASGKGSISMTSGNIDVNYTEWNDDLSISVVSGTANVTLPEGSGAELSFNGVSGTLKTDIGGEKGSYMNIGKGTNGTFGSGNVHKVSVNLTSGTVNLTRA